MGADRELLDLAAKAAGLDLTWKEGTCKGGHFEGAFVNGVSWAPLTDDGDNRRLQVKLCLGLVPIEDGGWACITWDHDEQVTLAAALDPNRAIVRAAAEIGRATP